jgi:TolB-like protein/Tfp pilus assembly protein PilF
MAVCVAVLSTVLAGTLWRKTVKAQQKHAGKVMLVVLPFHNMSGDLAQEYLSDGMTEELSAQLGNLDPRTLGVIGRTSAMTYKNSHVSISEIGRQLGVDYVLEGSVRRDGSKMRVTAQLVDASSQSHLWAESYDREMRDLLQLEADISGNIAREVGISIALAQPKTPAARAPNPEAHEAYLLGRYYWTRRLDGDWQTAEQHFRRVIQLDPQYSLAYAGLAECRIRKEEASAAALRAVELDPASAEARIALGWVELYQNLDLAAGGRAFQSAVQLDPNYASAHHSYGEYLGMVGRFEEAMAEKRQAVRLDPLSWRFRGALAGLLSVVGQNDAAMKEMNRVLELSPDNAMRHNMLADFQLSAGRYTEAIRELQLFGEHQGDPVLGRLGYAYAKSGRKKDAERILAKLRNLENVSGGSCWLTENVLVEIGLGRHDEALVWLQKAFRAHCNEDLLWLKADPLYDPLRSEPRFQALLQEMNFPR